MTILQLFTVFCLVIYCNGSCINDPNDPCLAAHYKTLNEPSRSAAYYDPNLSTKGDHSILEGWYRSISPAGEDMPTSSPENAHCQSFAPVWMQGTLPSVADRIVQRTACVKSFTNNCSSTINICVKNCVDYRVYYLYRPSGTYERYCFGNQLQCPSGHGSSNGFTPGCQDTTLLLADPTLSYTVHTTRLNKNTCQGNTTFQCNINHNINSSSLEIEWSISGSVIKTENKAYTQLPAQLTSDELALQGTSQYGFILKCQITARDMVSGTLGNARTSELNINFDMIKSQLKDANPLVTASKASVTFQYECQSVEESVEKSVEESVEKSVDKNVDNQGRNNTCWDCNTIKGCTKKPRSCIIDNVCYRDGVSNPSNFGELCSPSDSQYMWTSKSDDSLGLKIGLGVTGALLVIVLVILIVCVLKGKRGEKNQVQINGRNNNQLEPRVMTPPPTYSQDDPYIADMYKSALTPVKHTGLQKNLHY